MNGTMICGGASVYGFVAELRSSLPVSIGCLLWLAPQWPDIQPFIPLYAGVNGFPADYCRPDYPKSLDDHYNPPADIHERNDQHAFWAFVEFSERMSDHYGKYIGMVRKTNFKIERKLLKVQPSLERKLLKIYEGSPEQCSKVLTGLYGNFAVKALEQTRKSIKKINRAN
jgi:dipeptidase